MKTTQTTAIQPIGALHRPRCHGAGAEVGLRRRSEDRA